MCDVRWVSNSNEAGLCGLPFENRVTVILSFLVLVAPASYNSGIAHSLFVVSVPMTKSLAFTLKAIFAKLNWPLKPKLRWQKKGLDLIRHGHQSCPLFRIGSAQLIKAYSVQAWWLSDLFFAWYEWHVSTIKSFCLAEWSQTWARAHTIFLKSRPLWQNEFCDKGRTHTVHTASVLTNASI